jgi:hypothetical protein
VYQKGQYHACERKVQLRKVSALYSHEGLILNMCLDLHVELDEVKESLTEGLLAVRGAIDEALAALARHDD